ncbi:hypothetical protein FKM82_019258 [Ascaphus truei]
MPGSKSFGRTISGRTMVTAAPESSKPAAWRAPMVTGRRCLNRTWCNLMSLCLRCWFLVQISPWRFPAGLVRRLYLTPLCEPVAHGRPAAGEGCP